MAKPQVYMVPGANVELTDTFASWIGITNQIIEDMGTIVVTTTSFPQANATVGGVTTGNAHIEGHFSANTIAIVDTLHGGEMSGSANLVITSNVVFNQSALVQLDGNTNNFNVNANNATFTSNVTINNAAKKVSITAANTTIAQGTLYVHSNVVADGTTASITVNTVDITSASDTTIDAGKIKIDATNGLDIGLTKTGKAITVNGNISHSGNANFTGRNTEFHANVATIQGNTVAVTGGNVNVTGAHANLAFTTGITLSAVDSDIKAYTTAVNIGEPAKPFNNVYANNAILDHDVTVRGNSYLEGNAVKNLTVKSTTAAMQPLNIAFANTSTSVDTVKVTDKGIIPATGDTISLGNTTAAWNETFTKTLTVNQNAIVTGNVAVNGGNMTSGNGTFNLLNQAATVTAFSNAATLGIGRNSGTLTLKNPTIVGNTTVNFMNTSTSINVGATTGTFKVNNENIEGHNNVKMFNTSSGTVQVFENAANIIVGTNSTNISIGSSSDTNTINIAGGATSSGKVKSLSLGTNGVAGSTTNIEIGSTNGGNIQLNSANIATPQTSVALFNTNATTVNAFGAATALNLGGASGNTNIKNNLVLTGTANIVGGSIATNKTTANVFNTTSTTVNAFGAATTLNIGASTGTMTLKNPTIVGNTSVNFLNTSTAINVGATTGTFKVNNENIEGHANVKMFNTSSGTVQAFENSNVLAIGTNTPTISVGDGYTGNTSYNIGNGVTAPGNTKFIAIGTNGVAGSTTNIFIGSQYGGNIQLNSANIVTPQTTLALFNTNATTVNAFGAATALNLGAATGSTNINNNIVVTGTANIVGGSIATNKTTANVFNTTSTTVNAFGAATTLNIGATSGTLVVKNPNVTAPASANLFNTVTTTANVLGAATNITLGNSAGTISVQNPTATFGTAGVNSTVNILGNGVGGTAMLGSNVTTGTFKIANSITTGTVELGSAANGGVKILATTDASSTTTGALTIAGGVGIAKKLYVGGNARITGDVTFDGNVSFTNSNISITTDTSQINDLTVYNTVTLDNATITTPIIPDTGALTIGASNKRWNIVYANTLDTNNLVANNITSNTEITKSLSVYDSTKDRIVLASSAFGSSNRAITIKTPDTAIGGNYSLTLANGNTVLQAGTMGVTGTGLQQFAATTSAQLAGVISDETGTGNLVFSTNAVMSGTKLTDAEIQETGAKFKGSTSGTTILKATAATGSGTITMPTATGTMALTSDIKNSTITFAAGSGMSGGGSMTTNQASASTITLTNADKGSDQKIVKNFVAGGKTIVANTNNDTITFDTVGAISVAANTSTNTITITAGSVETLESVTGRGNTTSKAIQISNTTESTGVTSGALRVDGGVGIGKKLYVGNTATFFGEVLIKDITVTGNLVVTGTTTTINANDLDVMDKNIVIGNVTSPTNDTANGGGITLKGATDKTIIWEKTGTNWSFSDNVNLATGKTFKINNTEVLSATTLGSNVLTSSLTAVGNITIGSWNATQIAITKGGTGATDAAGARSNLGLVLQTSKSDDTAGRVLTVGAFGMGMNNDLRGTWAEGPPSAYYKKGTSIGLAGTSNIGMTGSSYATLIAMGHWSDSSGLNAINRLAINPSLGLSVSNSIDANTWSSWYEVFDTRNLATEAEAKEGSNTAKVMSPKRVDDYFRDASLANLKIKAISDTTGTLALNRGGTGATNAAGARTNLGLGSISTLNTVDIVSNTTGTLSVERGGTGATDAANARSNLGIVIATQAQANVATDNSVYMTPLTTDYYFKNASLANLKTRVITDTTGTLPLNRGGTGATDAANARSNLGIVIATTAQANAATDDTVYMTPKKTDDYFKNASLANLKTKNISDTTGTLALNRGGTGATNAAGARTNLGLGSASTVNVASNAIVFSNSSDLINHQGIVDIFNAHGKSFTIGDGSATSFTVQHMLDSYQLVITVRDITNQRVVYPDITYLNNNNIKVEFVSAPTNNQFEVNIMRQGFKYV